MSQHLQNAKKFAQWFLGFPLTILAFFFIFSVIYKSLDTILPALHTVNSTLLIIGVICLCAFFAIKSYSWSRVLQLLGHEISYPNSTYLLTISELKRYIPGSIFGFISRAHNFNKEKVRSKTTVHALLIESVFMVISSLVVGIPAILILYSHLAQYVPLIAISLGVLLCVGLCSGVYIVFRKKKMSGVSKLLKKQNFPLFAHLTVVNIVMWMLFGLGNYCIATAFVFVDPKYIVYICSLAVLSWTIGYVSVITPMGLGVREAILILGLSFVMPLSSASVIAILLRFGFIVSELIFVGIATALKKYQKYITSYFCRFSPQAWVVGIASTLYAVYFSYFTIQKHNNFFTGRFDLGNMDQTVWNSLHGNFFLFTNPDSTHTISRLAFHADVILVLLAPFYLIWSDPRMLLIVQSVVVASGAIFLYALSQEVVRNRNISLVIAISFLLNPFVQWMNSYDFHAVVMAMSFFIAAFYFLTKKNWILFCTFLILAALTKENIYLITALIGVYLMVKRLNVKLGVVITVVSISVFLLIMKKIIPDIRGQDHFAVQFLSDFGDSTTEIMRNIVLHPSKTFSLLYKNNALGYAASLLLPVGFLSIFSPVYLLFAGPDFLKNALSSNPGFRQVYYQYNAEIIPFIYISTIYGVKWLLSKKSIILSPLLVGIIVICAIYAQWTSGVLPGAKRAQIQIFNQPTPYATQIRGYLSTISENKKVAATNNIGAHLSQREYIFVIPQGMDAADYIIFLLGDSAAKPSPQAQREMINTMFQNPRYTLEYQIGNFYSFKRVK